MEVSHFTDALSVSFFALLGIWAALVRRHWFLRFAAVGGFLLIALLLPAYELVIEFGLQMAVIAVGVWLARGRHRWRPRLSLETAMLLTVVLAIVFAIVGRLPEFDAQTWLSMIGIGVVTACIALLCLWIVFGQSRLWIRIIGGALGVAALLAVLHFGHVTRSAMSNTSSLSWNAIFANGYQWHSVTWWFAWNLKTTAIGLTVMLTTLTLARHSGWFESNAAAALVPVNRRMIVARIGMCTMLLAIATPLFYVFYRLLTPPPLPPLDLPTHNGYEGILAAGRTAPPELEIVDLSTIDAWTFARFQRTFDLAAPVANQIEAAVKKPSRIVDPFTISYGEVRAKEMAYLRRVYNGLVLRVRYFQRFGSRREYLDALLLFLRYGHAVNRGGADINDSSVGHIDYSTTDGLQSVMGQLTADECRAAAAELLEVDAAREPLAEVVARQRVVEKNRSWDGHLVALLVEWAGRDPIDDYQNAVDEEPYRIAQLRLTAIALALQAYWLEYRCPPDSLAELTPKYLPLLPIDNCSGKPFMYRRRGDRFTIYGFGPDRDDDHGTRPTSSEILAPGDLVTTGPCGPPQWMRLRDGTAEGLKSLWKAAANAAEPAAE